ncbi:hypothetical protein GcLGCM259_2962 [Glutamicibacter creatinolyticus]|uniref:Uncharacterized protein n=1 Tax=Glutamicibacter creatinolyticus TaxID=162496 RepID=A0A5B7WXA3_9MICC|nr:hypothetical protein GcLGCM259_2962 [Glutamicibacter creatinolyticus]
MNMIQISWTNGGGFAGFYARVRRVSPASGQMTI